MKSKSILILMVILTAASLISFMFIKNKNISILEQGYNPISATEQTKWNTYTNTKYGYTVSYPNIVQLQANEENIISSPESQKIELNLRGISNVGIEITIWAPYTYQTTDKNALEYNRITRLDLKSFSETLRQKFIDDRNDNFPNKKIGEIEEVIFAGRRAYTATVTGYTDGRGSDTFKYIYTNNGVNNIVIQYSLQGDLSKKIIDTFTFTR